MRRAEVHGRPNAASTFNPGCQHLRFSRAMTPDHTDAARCPHLLGSWI
jgi:hypothetical protein